MVPHVPSPPAAPPPPHLSRVTRRGHHHQLSLPLLHQAPTISWDFVFLSPLLFKTEVGVFAHRHTHGQVFALVAAVLHLPPVVWSCGFADTRSAGYVRSLLVPHRARLPSCQWVQHCPRSGGCCGRPLSPRAHPPPGFLGCALRGGLGVWGTLMFQLYTWWQKCPSSSGSVMPSRNLIL